MLVLLDAVVGTTVGGAAGTVVVVLSRAVVGGVVVDERVLELVGASVEVELDAFLPPLLHAARQGPWRLQLDERDSLHPRQSGRL